MRIVYFGDENSHVSNILFQYLVDITKKYSPVKISAVISTSIGFKSKAVEKRGFIKKMLTIFFSTLRTFKRRRTDIKSKNYLNLARKENIPIIIPPDNNINHPKCIDQIKNINPDLILICGCNQIVKTDLIKQSPDKIINYHWSLLPKYRGRGATIWPIIEGERYSGFTYHYVNEEIDRGDIALQRKVEIDINDNSETLGKKLLEEGGKDLEKLVLLALKKQIPKIPLEIKKEKYYSLKDTKNVRFIDWSAPSEQIIRTFFAIGEMFTTTHNKKTLNITGLKISEDKDNFVNHKIGEIINISTKGIKVFGSDRILLISSIYYLPSFVVAKLFGFKKGMVLQ